MAFLLSQKHPAEPKRTHIRVWGRWNRGFAAAALQVMFKVSTLVESSMIGATPTRNADPTFKMSGPAPLVEAPQEIKVYNKSNPRHTLRELMKYALAGKQLFQDCIPSAFCHCR